MFIPHLILPNSVVVTSPDGTPVSIDKSHYNYDEVVTLLTTSSGTYDQIIDLMQPIREFRRALSASNFYENGDGLVCIDLDGYPFILPAELQQEVLRINRSNGNLVPLENFVANLANNPDKKVHDQLYGFISACGLTLTEDGHFLAYKKVRDDFMDIYSGTVDNSPGTTLKPMPRWACDSNPNNTCSSGYHFAAWGYLQHYGASNGTRIVIVKVDPAEVVAIPVDYNNMKGRACTYKVLKEIAVPEELKNTSVYNEDDESDDEFGDGWADDDFEDEQEYDSEEDELRAAAKDELLKVMSEEDAEELLDLVERMAASLK
jgi:hypothetical protein